MKLPTSSLKSSLSVVIPVYRNAATLPELLKRLEWVFEQNSMSYEVVFVVDACPENSEAILKALAKENPNIQILKLQKNIGQQRAILKGLALAQGRSVVVMDGDLQDAPETIPELIKKMEEGYSAVFAGRRGVYESRFRLLTSKVFKRLLHHLTGVPPDSGAFVVLERAMVDCLLAMNPSFVFLVAMIGATGLKTVSIPVDRSLRPQGVSSYNSWMRFKIGMKALIWVVLNKSRRGY